MSFRLEMLQVARLAPRMLGEAAPLVANFLKSQQNSDGGFKDRSGRSDLYYTVFGVDGLLALQEPFDCASLEAYLKSITNPEKLDLVHLSCWGRGWSTYAQLTRTAIPPEVPQIVLSVLEQHATGDGGYHILPDQQQASVYGNFVAVGVCQDLGVQLPNPLKLIQSLKLLETDDGSWANDQFMKVGNVPATAAAVTLLRHFGMPINSSVGDWLLKQVHAQGGFLAMPFAPIPDLLSTATALHALSGLQVNLDPIREKTLDYIDTLWTNEGSFHGHWNEELLDTEYTFYGLLALGHLAV
jgi:prenyltransferase beta subunit